MPLRALPAAPPAATVPPAATAPAGAGEPRILSAAGASAFELGTSSLAALRVQGVPCKLSFPFFARCAVGFRLDNPVPRLERGRRRSVLSPLFQEVGGTLF